jgi:hypothetical protein
MPNSLPVAINPGPTDDKSLTRCYRQFGGYQTEARPSPFITLTLKLTAAYSL